MVVGRRTSRRTFVEPMPQRKASGRRSRRMRVTGVNRLEAVYRNSGLTPEAGTGIGVAPRENRALVPGGVLSSETRAFLLGQTIGWAA
ncbi:hypothetical protein [Paenibacillus beijingensis]|uniref:hypothetical protein n=1 Tax=Paenibacillus beijingensis TaxID=1126833 RepID=UPI0011DD9C67|nr:hypothetical protein [Paenibacillus beijingensis]